MDSGNDELVQEIKELREEVRQMKEIITVLFTMIVESEEDDEETSAMFPSGMEAPKMNN